MRSGIPRKQSSNEETADPTEEGRAGVTVERLGLRSLVDVAEGLTGNFDETRMLERLASDCVALLGISGSGVMLASPQQLAAASFGLPARPA